MTSTGDITIKGVNVTIEGTTTKIIGNTLTEVGKPKGTTGMVVDGNVTIKGGQVDIN
jgi:phage baseplate assembly protein gpV